MAEKQKGKNVLRPYRGIVTDFAPVDQPPGTLSYALNAIDENDEGYQSNKSNEPGARACGQLTPGYLPVGDVYIGEDSFAVFSVNRSNNRSEIGITDKFCNYTPVVNSGCLNFNIAYQIDATYRLRRGCEKTVYFANGKLNPLRYINFARLSDFYSEDYIYHLVNTPGADFTGEKWDCDKFKMVASYQIPCIAHQEVITGGKNRSGTYNFSIQYLDADYNPTPWIYSSQLVAIYSDNITNPFNTITGSSNFDVDPIAGTIETNKAIELTLSNLDTQYPYYRVAVARASNSTGLVDKVVVSPVNTIERTTFIYDGLNEGYTEIPKEELLVKKTDLEFAEHIDQLENRLIIAKLTGKQINWCDFQKYASKIASRYVIREASATDQSSLGNSKNPDTYFVREGHMGDEVYARGIVYVFRDGFESPAFHIPGRPLNKYYDFDTEQCEDIEDDAVLPWSEDLLPWFEDIAAYIAAGADMKFWEVFDSSLRTSIEADANTYGAMQYHENRNAVYEPKTDCNNNDYWGVDCCGNKLANTPVRHHRFPSRAKEKLIRGATGFTAESGVYITVKLKDDTDFPAVASVTLEVEFENPIGTPQTITTTIYPPTDTDPTHLVPPTVNYQIYLFSGDVTDFELIDITGTIVTTYSDLFDYSVEVKPANQNYSNETVIRNLGIEFSNIEYPHPDIVGHYFVRAERDENNRTILDKGIFGRMRTATPMSKTFTAFSYFTKSNNSEYNSYVFTPRFLFNRDTVKPDFIKSECKFNFAGQHVMARTIDDPEFKGISGRETDVIIEARQQHYSGVTLLPGHNYTTDKTVLLDGLAYDDLINTGERTYNISWSNRVQVVKTKNVLPYSGDDIFYASMKVNRDIYPNLDSIKYYRTHNCMLTLDHSQVVFGGDTFISEFSLSNSLWRKQTKGIGVLIWSIIGFVALLAVSVFTLGAAAAAAIPALVAAITITSTLTIALAAAGIVATSITAIIKAYEEDGLDELVDDAEFDEADEHGRWNGYMSLANENIYGTYVESELNISLRQKQQNECGDFFKHDIDILDYFTARWMYDKENNGELVRRGIPCPEVYHYNADFSRMNKESEYLSLPSSYNCCTDCLEEHPNRVAYSEQSFQEELIDNYKIFKPNNYRDIESEKGVITDIIRMNNKLYILTTESCWELPQTFQERVTGDLLSFIGTGEFFSVPPREVIDETNGAMGTQHKWAVLKTRQGILIVNEIEGKIYLKSNDNALAISSLGNFNWFKENLKDFFASDFLRTTGIPYPYLNNPANPEGIGIHSTFDSEYNRAIITKKDYLIVEDMYSEELVEGKITWNTELNIFQTKINGVTTTVSLANRGFFENKSWTVSFRLDGERSYLCSWHSYIPNYYIHTPNNLYSFSSNEIWRHNAKDVFHSWYGFSYPHILEYISIENPLQDKIWDDLALQVLARRYNATSKDYVDLRDIVFNKAIFYNSRQTTGLQTLVVKATEADDENYLSNQVADRTGEILINRTERNWCINDIRDYRTDYLKPVFLRNWTAIRSEFPIDKVLDTTVIDTAKDWTELESLRDKFLIIRLIFDNLHDVKLITNYSIDEPTDSFR